MFCKVCEALGRLSYDVTWHPMAFFGIETVQSLSPITLHERGSRLNILSCNFTNGRDLNGHPSDMSQSYCEDEEEIHDQAELLQ